MTPEEKSAQLALRQGKQIYMVKEFIEVFKQKPDAALQAKLIMEEAAEVFEAAEALRDNNTIETMDHYLKECGDFLYVLVGFVAITDLIGVEKVGEQLEAEEGLAMQMVITNELATSLINGSYEIFLNDDIVEDIFNRIHASNMSKLYEGEPIFDERGKVMKGPNYVKPDLSDLAADLSDRYAQHTAALILAQECDEDELAA